MSISMSVYAGEEAGRGGVVWYPASHQFQCCPLIYSAASVLTSSLQGAHYGVRCEKSPTRRWELRTAANDSQNPVLK